MANQVLMTECFAFLGIVMDVYEIMYVTDMIIKQVIITKLPMYIAGCEYLNFAPCILQKLRITVESAKNTLLLRKKNYVRKLRTYFCQDVKFPAKAHNIPICRNERLLDYSINSLYGIHRWSNRQHYSTSRPTLLVWVVFHCNETAVLSA